MEIRDQVGKQDSNPKAITYPFCHLGME